MTARVTRPLTLKLDELDSMLIADPDVVADNHEAKSVGGNRVAIKANYGSVQRLVQRALREGHTHVTFAFEERH